jgi:glycosyltransferase involved in cell wall biosynthesis
VSTYPPRRCGIATFTLDLARATGDREIVALHPHGQAAPYPIEVHHRIRRDVLDDYARAARAIEPCVDVVSIQHEYGIWGGDEGAYILDFVKALRVPAVATLHTVHQHPTPAQRTILSQLIDSVAATVVMSRAAASILTSAYGVEANQVEIIPHGVPDLPLVDSATVKADLGLQGRDVILSFGLLSRGKGFELAIEALPAVVAANPSALYVVVGATHPELLRTEGEAYRQTLLGHVARLGLQNHVRFVDRFVGRVELAHWMKAADIFVTPYPNLDQVSSGTLAYAMSAGRAIVSSPYAYAAELLADGRGVLVTPGSATALATALNDVLGDPEFRSALGRRAHDHSRQMVWSTVGEKYQHLFAQVSTTALAAAPETPVAMVVAAGLDIAIGQHLPTAPIAADSLPAGSPA